MASPPESGPPADPPPSEPTPSGPPPSERPTPPEPASEPERPTGADWRAETWLRPSISRLWWFTGPVLAALVVAVTVVAAMPVPYLSIAPGSARSVEPLVSILATEDGPEPHREEPDDGLLFVTVSVRRPAGIEALWDLTDGAIEVVPEDVVTGGQTREENNRFNLALMTASKDKAAKVALERAGYEVPVHTTGAVVTDLDPSYPVAEVVHPGDTIVSADGTDVDRADDLVEIIGAHRPGDEISLTIEPIGSGDRRTVTARLASRPDDASKPLLGVTLGDRPSFSFPIEVEIDSGKVGGPSAGLAFTLAILDRITEGDLTGGHRVAVTGTIQLDGSVGPVGGVHQKTEAAIDAGATLFLVPPDEFDEAREVADGRIEIRRVASLEDALDALQSIGGDPVPAPPDRGEGSGSGRGAGG